MPKKKDGMLFEVHPTPAKGRDGKNIVYVRPAMNHKVTMQGLEDFCNRNYNSPYGEMMRAFDYFLRAAGELMAMGYRVETPIGSFAPRLKLLREIRQRDEHRVREMLGQIGRDEKTLVFCCTQRHAMIIRDMINQQKLVPDSNYCERVTADDGAEGEKKLKLKALR